MCEAFFKQFRRLVFPYTQSHAAKSVDSYRHLPVDCGHEGVLSDYEELCALTTTLLCVYSAKCLYGLYRSRSLPTDTENGPSVLLREATFQGFYVPSMLLS